MPDVTLLRSVERFTTRVPGITTRHCFSYGEHYDPGNTGFGALRAVNEEQLEPGAGYEMHRHADVEIVTWVLDGALAHEDSAGNHGVIRPGGVQFLSAGAGVEHTERNASGSESLRFVQMMLTPSDEALRADPLPPVYRQHAVEGSRGRLLRAFTVRDGVELYVAFLDPYDLVAAPSRGDVHLHVTRGGVQLDGAGHLGEGDTARVSGSGGLQLRAEEPAEVLLWHLADGRE